MRQRKSWASSVSFGALKATAWTPIGFTPENTFLTVPSLPPASMAWRTTRSDRVCSAHNRACSPATRSSSTSVAARVSSLPPGAPSVLSVSKSARSTFVRGGTRHRSDALMTLTVLLRNREIERWRTRANFGWVAAFVGCERARAARARGVRVAGRARRRRATRTPAWCSTPTGRRSSTRCACRRSTRRSPKRSRRSGSRCAASC